MGEIPPIEDRDRFVVAQALLHPRGFYDAKRASQLSGVPQSTISHWAGSGILTPDWKAFRPRGWSYRDLLYLRLLVWLRRRKMALPEASRRVRLIRDALAVDHIDPTVRSDGQHAFLNSETRDRFSGQGAFAEIMPCLPAFDIVKPVDGVSRSAMWGPGLVYPSPHTHISPLVLSGEPRVTRSRILTSSLFALRRERHLPSEKILSLYPQLTVEAIRDAIGLEQRLRLRESRHDATAA